MKKIIFFILSFLVVLSFHSALADGWWNSSWHFRVPVYVNSSVEVENATVEIVNINFTSIMEGENVSGSFDSDSIRIIENGYSYPYDWENETIDKGNLTWIANGTLNSSNRMFWVYFDILENGKKEPVEKITENPYWRSGYTNKMDVYSPHWNRTWAKRIEVGWKWSTEASYDFAYLYVDGVNVESKSGTGSENTSFYGSDIQGKFYSDESITVPTTDEYGTYGCAIDWIKFYQVTNYTSVELNRTLGNLDKQNLNNFLQSPQTNTTFYQSDQVLIRGNVTDEEYNLISGASVYFILMNGANEYICPASAEGDGWYNCTWDSTKKPPGNYSIRMNSSANYFDSNSTMFSNVFSLESGPPIVSINLSSSQIQQLSWIQINATVEDQSGYGINWTRVNITQPNGFLDQYNMTNVSNTWILNYTNTSQRGVYNITVYAKDNYGKIGSSEDNFKIYVGLNVTLRTLSNIYYPGNYGTVYYLLEDLSGTKISGANVTLRIKGPEGKNFWKVEKITNSNGTIETLPSFSLGNDWPLGNYSLLANTNYFDPVTNTSVSEDEEYVFRVLEEPDSLFLYLAEEKEDEEALGISATVTNGLRNIDPDWINVSLYDPADSIVCLEKIDGSCKYNVEMDKREDGKGLYYKKYSPNSSISGSWRWRVSVGKGTQVVTKEIFTKLSAGIFDLRNITITDNSIPKLSVSAVVENVKEGRDVTLEWNLTRTDTGLSLDSGMDTFYVGSNSEKTYIVTPTTNYLGEVKITMILFDTESEEAKAGAYEVFYTTESTTTTTISSQGGGPSAPARPEVSKIKEIKITNYPKEVEIEKGWIGYAILDVNNSGNVALHNIKIGVDGINKEWVELPKKSDVLLPGKLKNFTIKFSIPLSADSGNYEGKFTVVSDEASDEKSFVLRIFSSKAELIVYQIQTLKNRLKSLDEDVVKAENEGRDVSKAKDMLDDARTNIRVSEEYIDSKMYDKATYRVRITRDILDKAEIEIKTAKKKYIIPFLGPIFYQYNLITTITLIFIIILIIYMIRRLGQLKVHKISLSDLKNAITWKSSISELKKEKEKIERVTELIEKEYKSGLISKDSYEELKRENDKRIKEIDKKLSEGQ